MDDTEHLSPPSERITCTITYGDGGKVVHLQTEHSGVIRARVSQPW